MKGEISLKARTFLVKSPVSVNLRALRKLLNIGGPGLKTFLSFPFVHLLIFFMSKKFFPPYLVSCYVKIDKTSVTFRIHSKDTLETVECQFCKKQFSANKNMGDQYKPSQLSGSSHS